MIKELIIAYDRSTTKKDMQYTKSIYIFDEYSTFEELMNGWVGAYNIPCATSWKIIIHDRELFPKFKKLFFKINDIFPLIKSFKDIDMISFPKMGIGFGCLQVVKPTEENMADFEDIMERENNEQETGLI